MKAERRTMTRNFGQNVTKRGTGMNTRDSWNLMVLVFGTKNFQFLNYAIKFVSFSMVDLLIERLPI